MPTIELNRNVIEKILGKRLPDKELRERISMFGTPVEELTKDEIKVEVFPNRPDLLSERGFGRAFASFLGIKKGLKEYSIKDSKQKVIVDGSVSKVRPFTVCAIVNGINFNDETIKEVIKIQEKLHITYGRNRKRCAIGVYPLEKISFPVRYLAKKPEEIRFRPLDGKSVMNGRQILETHPTGREHKHLLKNEDVYPVFIDSTNKILSMPPIINSDDVGKVDVKTKNVFVECTGFDLNVLKKCLNMIVCALSDIGGEIYSVNVEYKGKTVKTPDLNPEKLKLDISYVNKRLGLNLKDGEIKTLLEKMGFGYSSGNALIPAYRTDIIHQIDLVEDIAIAYGYDNFVEEIPRISTIGREDDFERFKGRVANILVGMGFDEMNSTNIIDERTQKDKMLSATKPVMLFNSLTSEYNSLRNMILPGLLSALQQNKNSEYPQNIFEIGNVFKFDKTGKSETGIIENTRVCVALCHKNAGFTEVRQKFDRLMNLIGVNYGVNIGEHNSFIPGRVARASVNGVDVAYFGEINPHVIVNFGLNMPVAAFELNLTELFNLLRFK